MTDKNAREELEAQLRSKSDEIKARVEALEHEATTAGQAVQRFVSKHPVLSVGATVATGVALGMLFTGKKRRDAFGTGGAHHALVEQYISAVADEVQSAAKAGMKPDEAVQEALRDRVPLIIYGAAPAEEQSRPGLLREGWDLLVKSALGFAVKAATDFMTASLQQQLSMQESAAAAAAMAPPPEEMPSE